MESESAIGWGEVFGSVVDIDSVLIPGYVDLDMPGSRVHLFPTQVALGSIDGLALFAADGYSGQLIFRLVAEVSTPIELVEEPSMSPVLVDLDHILLPGSTPRRIESIALYLDGESDLREHRVRGAAVFLDGGGVVAMDPMSTLGIDIGGAGIADALDRDVITGGGIRVDVRP